MKKVVAPQTQTAVGAHSLRFLWLFLAGYTLLFWGLACRKSSMLNSSTGETAIIVHGLWATLHGKFFWHNSLNMSYFGDHGGLILTLLLPFYALFPSAATVLLLQSSFIAACGIPIFLIARRVLNDRVAAWCSMVAFLFFPTIVSQHVNQVHDTQFILPFLLFTFYFYETKQFGRFVALAAVCCLGKENVPLTLMMFGVYAALQRRQWKWIVTPIALSAVTLGLLFKVVMPYFRGGQPYRSFGYFGSLGDTPGQVLANIFAHPGKIVSTLLSAQNLSFLVQLTQPVGWVLPFLSLPVILALPDLVVNLLVENVSLKVIRWHYNMTVGAFLCVAAIYSIRKVSGWLAKRYGEGRYAAGLSVLLVCLCVSHWILWFNLDEYQPAPQREALLQAINLVPKESSVLVPASLLAEAAPRWYALDPQYYLYIKPQPEKILDYQYLIFDMNERQQPIPPKLVEALAADRSYELLFNSQNVLVFRRAGGEVLK
jgi:uncharacterized membrane protein